RRGRRPGRAALPGPAGRGLARRQRFHRLPPDLDRAAPRPPGRPGPRWLPDPAQRLAGLPGRQRSTTRNEERPPVGVAAPTEGLDPARPNGQEARPAMQSTAQVVRLDPRSTHRREPAHRPGRGQRGLTVGESLTVLLPLVAAATLARQMAVL